MRLALPVLLLLCGAAAAEAHRSHLAAHLLPRLDGRVQQNARATMPLVIAKLDATSQLTLGHGTGFFVSRAAATGRALIMTNQHVVEGARGQFAAIQGRGAELVRAQTRVVASSRRLDYALLEVTLPAGARVRPVTLSATRPEREVYCIGYAAIQQLPGHRLGGSPRSWHRATSDVPAPANADPMMAAADALARSPQVIALGSGNRAAVAKSSRERNTAYFDVPGAPGASGSAVFSRATHDVVGLLYGASPTTQGDLAAAATPMHLIVKDLHERLANLPPADRRQVQRVLRAVR